MMRVAINCRSILKPNLTGIGRNTSYLLNSLGKIDQENQYILYCSKRLFDSKRVLPCFPYDNFKVKEDNFGFGPRFMLGKHNIYHLPNPDDVPDHPVPIVVTIHDLIYKTYPQSHTQETIDLTHRYMQSVIKKAAKIICVSNQTRQDLHRYFDIPQTRSCVVYNGVDHEIFFKIEEQDLPAARVMLNKKGIDGPYILFVGTIEPRKNLANVLKAFALLVKKNKFQGQLVVVGGRGWKTEKINPLIEGLGIKSHVLFLGFTNDQELRILYNCAELFVYPSFYEGFGFPIVEAFCCGTAVVTSNVSSCPEIAGDAALRVDPTSEEQIADTMASILENPQLKADLQSKALKRAQEFCFMKGAREVLKVYREVYEG